MEPSFYAIIPATVRYDERLRPNAKLLYGEITALAQREGFCWAGNDYFADLYKVDVKTISRWVSQLEKYGYVSVELLKNQGNKRKIGIDKIVTTYGQKSHEVVTKKSIASDEIVTSNIRMNNTENKALDFFKENNPSLYETFLMQYQSKIKDFQKFCELFNCKVDEEDLEWTGKKINARLTRFAINYIENENKAFGKQQPPVQQQTQQYSKNSF
ncbi:helix-turn-helix domain-containing protein [Myroides odoratus]|uniref:helix-turn-helix domain-containing protein n=1 Tax=Myroides odoratus TaxID=256 RepID=UPI0039B01711